MLKGLRTIFLCVVALWVAGCGSVPVAQDRTQKQANQIVAILAAYGIPAASDRTTGARSLYTVSVSSGHYSSAASILEDWKLLKDDNLKALLEPRGLIPNSREMEKLRVDHARAVEVEELLESHPAVGTVKVLIHQSALQGGVEAPASASVIVWPRSGFTVGEEEIRQIVLRAVPGILPEKIAVSLNAPPQDFRLKVHGVSNEDGKVIALPLVPFVLGGRVAEGDYSQLAVSLLGFLVMVGILGGVVGYWSAVYRHSAPIQRLSLPESGQKVSRIEKATRELPEGDS